MEKLAGQPPGSGPIAEFKLVVAYDDFGHANCARNFMERLVESFGESLTFVPCFLKFEELSRPDVGERLAREVASADMFVIVAYEHADLPDPMEQWVRSWETTKRTRGCQLLALVSASRSGSRRWTPVQSRLRQVARRTGMKFVLQTASLSEPRDGSDNAPAKAGYSWEERQRTRGDLGGDSGSSTNALEVVVAGEKPADDHVMAAAGAIVQLMRARRCQAHLPTIAPANRRCRQLLETNQNRM
ncbi:MAG TPA: hypothetical protein VN765_17015 [Candidatus Acidoferrum sp.]|nr:hypothetical protein [Candidatus Acidoferrum sp.]